MARKLEIVRDLENPLALEQQVCLELEELRALHQSLTRFIEVAHAATTAQEAS